MAAGWSDSDLACRAGRGSRERQFCSSGAELSQPDLSRLCLQEEVVTQTDKDRLIMAKKKGFMTPERKKKLRTLLRKKAAEELKKEQERKAEERLRVIAERCGTKADIENASVDDLKKICQQYFDKWYKLEAEMFFLQREVILRDLQINELTISVSDMKGKFIKPSLKKVSKYENKFAKLQEKAAKFAFANQLKAK